MTKYKLLGLEEYYVEEGFYLNENLDMVDLDALDEIQQELIKTLCLYRPETGEQFLNVSTNIINEEYKFCNSIEEFRASKEIGTCLRCGDKFAIIPLTTDKEKRLVCPSTILYTEDEL